MTQDGTAGAAELPYRPIVAGIGEGAATVSAAGIVLSANARLGELLGRASSELVGSPVLDLAAGTTDATDATNAAGTTDTARFAAALGTAAGETAQAPLDLRRADGTTVPVLASVTGLQVDPATLVRCLIVTDLSPGRAAEAELARSHAESREREAFLEEASEMVGLGTWEASPTMAGPVTWSDNVYAITGRTRESFDPRAATALAPVHPDDRSKVLAAFTDAIAGRARFRVRNRIVRPTGEVRWVEQAAVVERDAGTPTRVLGVIQDITDAVAAADLARDQAAELERQVAARTADLRAANEDLEEFTYSVSHDLRAPLRAINAFSQALVDECSDALGERGRYYAARVRANGEEMARLLEALLGLSRLSRAELRFQPVDLSELVRSIVADLRERDPDRPVRIGVQDKVRTTADPDLMRSALRNLLDNAWKFTGPRAVAEIEFGGESIGGSAVRCYVRDNGVGFDPAHADRLFQPFQRMHSAEAFPGTGMGLASVRRIVERHGGRVWAEGRVDGGTTITFVLDPDRHPRS